MRKDVERLCQFYPWPGADEANDLSRLGWPSARDLAARFKALLSPIDFSRYTRDRQLRLLDLGSGLGFLLDYLKANRLLEFVDYTGVDLLDPMLNEAQGRWPNARFEKRDVREQPFPPGTFDYCIACGLFTVKHGNTYPETVAFAESTFKAVWPSVKFGLGFNSMSKHVDWERDDLFHWPLDDIMAFCKRDLSRNVSFRLDYGLWEVATLVLKSPRAADVIIPEEW